LTTPFSKMMKAWCSHYEIPQADATFVCDGVALMPEDTPNSMGHTSSKGDLRLQAMPRDAPEAEAAIRARTAGRGSTSASSSSSCGAAQQQSQPHHHQKECDQPPQAKGAQAGAAGQSGPVDIGDAKCPGVEAAAVEKRAGQARAKARTKRKKRRQRGAEGVGSGSEGSSCANGDEAEEQAEAAAAAKRRRSDRLRETPPEQALVTIVHHPPPDLKRRRKAGHSPTDMPQETGGIPVEAMPEHMTYQEYLRYDREQEKKREDARHQRAKLEAVNGAGDEDLQFAIALSLSMSQNETTARDPPGVSDVPAASSSATASAPQGESSGDGILGESVGLDSACPASV